MNQHNGNNGGNPGGPPPGFHFLKALGHAALAWGHVHFNQDDVEDEAPAPRQRRTQQTAQRSSKGGGSCCVVRRR